MAVLNDITVKRARPRANKYEITCEAVRGFVLRVLPSGRKIYFARHRPGGRDVRVRIGEADRITCNQARARAMEIIDDVVVTPRAAMRPAAQRVAAPPREPRRVAEGPTFAEFTRRYDREHISHNVKASTAERYRYQLRAHLLPAFGEMPLDQIAPVDVERLHASMSSKATTANNMIRVLSHMYTKAIDWQVLPRDHPRPTRTIRFYRERRVERFLTPEERAQLEHVLRRAEELPAGKTGAFSWGVVAAIRLLSLTGMRRNEVLTLTWSMVDTRHRCLRLPESKTGQRVIPASSHVFALLDELRARRDLDVPWVIHTRSGRPIHGTTLSKAWRAIRKHAGLHDVRLHDLRHSAASDAL
ncbi:MAG: tyrosine-type recombinase/integrase, partial [Myxococcales bacterium]|nr:tyrosine-type recombinase/integrase [Myxococcales bacterium]